MSLLKCAGLGQKLVPNHSAKLSIWLTKLRSTSRGGRDCDVEADVFLASLDLVDLKRGIQFLFQYYFPRWTYLFKSRPKQ